MIYQTLLLCASLLAATFIGCGGGPRTMQSADTGEVPEWFTNAPQDANFLFAANTATSQDLQLAIDKAVTGARSEIGRQTELRVQGLQKRFDEEVGVGSDAQLLQQFTQATKTVISTSLTGSRVRDQRHFRDGNIYRAYVLVEYPIGAANEALLQQIKKNEQLYTKFRSSQVFKELEDEVQKYEQSKSSENK